MRAGSEGVEDIPSLLAGGGDDGAQGGEVGRPFEGAKCARDLHLDLHHPQSLFGEVVGEGNGEVIKEAQDIVLVGLEPLEQVVSGPSLGSASCPFFERRQRAMEGEAAPDGLPIAGDEACDGGRRERRFARFARFFHRLVGLDEPIAHILRPGLFVERDQRLELTQMMGVAKGVVDAGQSAIGLEVVVDDDAARQAFRHGAALIRHPVEGQGLGRNRMQPLPFSGDAKTGFVEMAHRRLRREGADVRRANPAALSSTQVARLAAHR